MTARRIWKALALGIPAFAVLAFLVGVVGYGLLGIGQAPPPMDDLRVSNDDDGNHTVRIEVFPASDTSAKGLGDRTVFTATRTLESGATAAFDGVTPAGEEYRLVVTVDDRDSRTFEIDGPDDYCQTNVEIEAGGAVEVGTGCA
jgi:hypothetical protein